MTRAELLELLEAEIEAMEARHEAEELAMIEVWKPVAYGFGEFKVGLQDEAPTVLLPDGRVL